MRLISLTNKTLSKPVRKRQVFQQKKSTADEQKIHRRGNTHG